MPYIDWQDVGVRAFKTAAQVFLSSFPVAAAIGLDLDAFKSAALAAGAAGLAVVWNAALEWSRNR